MTAQSPLESPIAGLAFRGRELGRLRMGEKVDTGRKKDGRPVYRPEKLDTWRLTSTDWRRIKAAADAYGGEPETWAEAPGWNAEKQTGARQFQVTVTADAIPVQVPDPVEWDQAMEAWTAGERTRRCNRVVMDTGEECACAVDVDAGRTPPCKPYTRVRLILPELPGFGFWRLESHGWEAARELPPMVVLAAQFGRRETYLLRIDYRARQIKGPDGKPMTVSIPVPVLDLQRTPAEVFALAASEYPPAGMLERPPAVPASGEAPPAAAGASPQEAAG
jgi:hypothetical protein